MPDTRFEQALDDAMPAVEEDGQALQFQQHARCAPLVFDLAGACAEEGDAAH
jgi:hypothetical protein